MDSLYLITVKKITTIFQKTLTRSYDEKEKFGPSSKTKKKKNTDQKWPKKADTYLS